MNPLHWFLISCKIKRRMRRYVRYSGSVFNTIGSSKEVAIILRRVLIMFLLGAYAVIMVTAMLTLNFTAYNEVAVCVMETFMFPVMILLFFRWLLCWHEFKVGKLSVIAKIACAVSSILFVIVIITPIVMVGNYNVRVANIISTLIGVLAILGQLPDVCAKLDEDGILGK